MNQQMQTQFSIFFAIAMDFFEIEHLRLLNHTVLYFDYFTLILITLSLDSKC